MFVTYFSSTEQKMKTSFLGIVNLKGMMAADIMDAVQKFFHSKITENWDNITQYFRWNKLHKWKEKWTTERNKAVLSIQYLY